MCILADDGSFQNSKFYFVTNYKKAQGVFGNIKGIPMPIWKSNEERYHKLALTFMELLPPEENKVIYIEDYSLGSKGKVFNLAENCGHLKMMLYILNHPYYTIPPTVIKKFFHGKGNANKEKMENSFREKTDIDLMKLFAMKGKLKSPVTDIVDAYAIALYGRNKQDALC